METNNKEQWFWVWGVDRVAYGPVELPALVEWTQDERVTRDSWVFTGDSGAWTKAAELAELKMWFPDDTLTVRGTGSGGVCEAAGLQPKNLRRIKAFAELDDKQLESFLQYIEVLPIKQFATVVRQGDHGDAMYFILEGELRARVTVDGRESTLATLTIGDFFGEISLLDHGPRSADVLTNQDSVLLKISAAAFDKLRREAPALAAPFLFTVSRLVAGRLRNLNQRYQDSIHLSRAGAGH
jgi:CRP-like cAMP-binding protein